MENSLFFIWQTIQKCQLFFETSGRDEKPVPISKDHFTVNIDPYMTIYINFFYIHDQF